MADDFGRQVFRAAKHYAGVLMQQGAVITDGDWNEAEAIREHQIRSLVRDVLGPAIFVGTGFALTPNRNAITIGAGHAWIDGILCELGVDAHADAQPDLPRAPLPTDPGNYLVYLDVWHRQVSALEDPALSEPAVGGPDTSTRPAIVAQVRFHRVSDDDGSDADLAHALQAETTDAALAVTGDYSGAGNQLYRIEIHGAGGDARGPDATFKWSRDNGSTVAPLRSWTPTELRLDRMGRRFAPGDRLEVVDRTSILHRRPGPFIEIQSINEGLVSLSSRSEPIPDDLVDPFVRRWDGGPVSTGSRAAGAGIELGDGLESHFEGTRFLSGDYWLVAARTADSSAVWPDGSDAADPHPPRGIERRRASLALLRRDQSGWRLLRDLRPLLSR